MLPFIGDAISSHRSVSLTNLSLFNRLSIVVRYKMFNI